MDYKSAKKYVTGNRTPFFEVAKKYIGESSKILDVGAGDGQFARTIGRKDIYMLDGSRDAIEILRGEFQNCKLGSPDKLPYDDGFFDLIHTSHMIEHLSPQQLYDFMKEADRCLKKSGLLVISAPLLWTEFYDDMSHLKPYNPKLFERYLCDGLQGCSTRPLISSKYSVVEKTYRYNVLPCDDGEVFVYSEAVNKALKIFKLLKYKLGFRRLEKSGFTLVLQKNK